MTSTSKAREALKSAGEAVKRAVTRDAATGEWKVIDRRPDRASITVEVKSGSESRTVRLKGFPASSAYFSIKTK